MITDNKVLDNQKKTVKGILNMYATTRKDVHEAITNTLDIAFLEGVQVGLDEARKIFSDEPAIPSAMDEIRASENL